MSSRLANCTTYILAGGLGTRLRAATDVPKVIAPVNGRPFLHFLLDKLAAAGCGRVVLCTGHAADAVEGAAATWDGSMRVDFSREAEPLGTGGAVKLALTEDRPETFLLLNGDSFTDADLCAFFTQHSESGAGASVLLARVDEASRYGSVVLNDAGRIEQFAEKQGKGPGLINAGTYLMQTDFFMGHTPDGPFSLETDFLDVMEPGVLGGYVHDGCFIDIGLPATYAACGAFFDELGQGAA
ncbi:sugar phosphate nucleotidyltransferase [Pseudodesulfovibrio sp. zrk46]|uniref:sugar phosphate nucleotidyltransferase n=1 Tax=Pseudodesulfovibrio sp. zrk46 TaxID=2725288 RepID=UPI001449982F|nr:sugar phosphate nucleotidyltransferase [Pseudodesulfovibrio sp. zrk46]QJB55738.1 NTP transferase domain-containing protein [Pseudodesulfovibrio sp. zrk46]